MSTILDILSRLLLTQLFQTGEGHVQVAVHMLTQIHSFNFFKRNTTSFWPKHRRHHPVIVPTHAATNKTNSRPMVPTSPCIRKQCTPSHLALPIQRGSCPLASGSLSKNPLQRRPNRARSPVTAGRGPANPRGVWVSTLMVRTLTGVVPRIQSRPRLWDLTPPIVALIP